MIVKRRSAAYLIKIDETSSFMRIVSAIFIYYLFVGCLTSQQHASVSQGRICSDSFTCCHTEIDAADPTFYLTQSQYTGRVATGVPISKSLV